MVTSWAWLLSWALSVADVERRHRRPKQIAARPDVTWAAFCAFHVHADARAIAEYASQDYSHGPCQPRPRARAARLVLDGDEDSDKESQSVDQALANENVCGRSALHLFKAESAQEIKHGVCPWWDGPSSGRCLFTQEFNQLAAVAFANLPVEERRRYEMESCATKLEARDNRRRLRSKTTTQPQQAALAMLGDAREGLASAVEARSDFHASLWMQSRTADDACVAVPEEDVVKESPMHVDHYIAARSAFGTKQKCVDAFCARSAVVAKDSNSTANARGPRLCGSLCKLDTLPSLLVMRAKIMSVLLSFPSLVRKKPCLVALEEVLLVAEKEFKDEAGAVKRRVVGMAMVCNRSARAGPIPATCTLVRHSVPESLGHDFAADVPYVGEITTPIRRAHVRSMVQRGLNEFPSGGIGMLDHCTEDEWCKDLLAPFASDGRVSIANDSRLRLRRLDHEPLRQGSDTLRIIGVLRRFDKLIQRPVDQGVASSDEDISDSVHAFGSMRGAGARASDELDCLREDVGIDHEPFGSCGHRW